MFCDDIINNIFNKYFICLKNKHNIKNYFNFKKFYNQFNLYIKPNITSKLINISDINCIL